MSAHEDLFGSDDSDGSVPVPTKSAATPHGPQDAGAEPTPSTANRLRDAFGSDEEEDAEEPRGASPEASTAPLDIEAPLTELPGSENIRLAKLSNVLGIETKPFDPATFERTADVEVWTDDRGFTRVRVRNQNTIRWREAVQPDDTVVQQSNSRFVRWSDGSLQLLVGEEAWDVTELDTTHDNNYLFVKHQNVLQGQGLFPKKLAFRPASLNSKAHRRLTSEVDRRHTKTFKVRSVATVADPAREKAELEKREEMRIRDKAKLSRMQDRTMRQYPAAPAARLPRVALTTQFLEALPEDPPEGEADYAAVRADLQRSRRIDEQAELDAERRLANAKRDPPRMPHKAGKRQRYSSEEEGEDLGNANNMQDFIVDDDDDEGVGRKPRSEVRSKRGIVLSDDDD